MKSKILLGLGVLAITLAVLPMFAAFEAHVINVTATIENALEVNTTPIDFGTVFPNEVLYRDLVIELSDSFYREGRTDDVQYKIVQKPKPVPGTEGTTDGCIAEKAELYACINNFGGSLQEAIVSCSEDYNTELCYPSLCQFLSKEADTDVPNDQGIGAPHPIAQCMDGIDNDQDGFIDYPADQDCAQYGDNSESNPGDQPQVWGYLSKLARDIVDNWKLDLRVPCFVGECMQGEEGFLPPAWEHNIFGCDIWVEVTGVSNATSIPPGL